MADEQPIIVIKKKGGHAGHHGGAWKVAYADFVTAMMAFFMVMWLMNTTKPVQEAISGYFRDPNGTASKKGGSQDGKGSSALDPMKKEDFSKVKEQLMQQLQKMANFDKLKNQVSITLTDEGLKIEMREDSKGVFFENGDAKPTPILGDLLTVLSEEVGKLPNPVSIEGHTDSTQYANKGGYGNWELSTDRANMARKIMEAHGLRPNQVVQVRGFADNDLRDVDHPSAPENRRVTVLIQYNLANGDKRPGTVFNGTIGSIQAPPPPAEAAPAESPGSEKGAAKGPEKPEPAKAAAKE
ncbi:chemotaxis protein MotB [Bryocella elongata]|uniref:Chemotaxis protein MotB n=1 Tax=Bryocella elongata TaxID=863522 RepID=A0A1H5THI0_9BACT|nr:flagellar motor protein MotB [Bryocella elongata]SEF62224.1 chemotaxis protein MotB [Bryocella elongata]